jgi:hypothetical protein
MHFSGYQALSITVCVRVRVRVCVCGLSWPVVGLNLLFFKCKV